MKSIRLYIVAGLIALSAVAVWQIVGISPPLASADTRGCAGLAARMPNFEANRPARPLPPLAFQMDGAGMRTIADYRGRGVILNFWATWCLPCVREMPTLDRLHALVAGDGIDVLAVSIDREGAAVVDTFYRTNRIRNLDTLIDEDRKALRATSIQGLPTTLLIDRDGNEIGRVAGAAEWDSPGVVRDLRACLAGNRGTAGRPGAVPGAAGKG